MPIRNPAPIPPAEPDLGGIDSTGTEPETPAAASSDALRFLSSVEGFASLRKEDLATLADYSRFATLATGEYLMVEGDEDNLYGFIVATGRIALMKTSLSGKEFVVELLAPGDIFGLLLKLALEKVPLELSARAQSKSRILKVPVNKLIPVLNANPALYRDFVEHLLGNLQSSYRISRGLAHDRVEVRIATILLSLALKFARPLPAVQNYTIDITRQQIADLTGTTPETCIRVTRTMQRNGLIDIARPGIVRILNLLALQTLAEGE